MLDQALEYFKQECERNGEEHLLFDSYIPADGTYLIVQRTESGFEQKEPLEIKLDKKNRQLDRSQVDDTEFICMADYHSSLVEMNKPMDKTKQIHSNNYLSFFAKKTALLGEEGRASKLDSECIHNYYQILRNPMEKYQGKPKTEELYQAVEAEIDSPDGQRIDEIETWMIDHLPKITESLSGKDYLKIFFRYGSDEEEWKRDYQREGKRYLLPNIYNNNESNVKIGNDIYGLPNNNMSLNAKKPYLETKSRKQTVPYLIDLEQVLAQKKFFDYLLNLASAGKTNLYLNEEGIIALPYNEMLTLKQRRTFTGLFLRIKKGKEVEIHDADVISQYCPKLIRPFAVQAVLDVPMDKLSFPATTAETLEEMQEIIDRVYFGKVLIPNYFTEPKDISIKTDSSLVSNLILARTALFRWFMKGDETGVWPVLKRIGMPLVRGSIYQEFYYRAVAQFDLTVSLQAYFEGGKESMSDTIFERRKSLKEKIERNDAEFIQGDAEYFYAAGQVAAYLISKSKAGKIPLSLGNPIINAKKDSMLKEKLQVLYKRYDYALDPILEKRFMNLYAMVLRYTPDGAVNEMVLTAGLLDPNLMYTKKGKASETGEPEGQEEE